MSLELAFPFQKVAVKLSSCWRITDWLQITDHADAESPGSGLQDLEPDRGPAKAVTQGWARAFRVGLPGLKGFEPSPANHYPGRNTCRRKSEERNELPMI